MGANGSDSNSLFRGSRSKATTKSYEVNKDEKAKSTTRDKYKSLNMNIDDNSLIGGHLDGLNRSADLLKNITDELNPEFVSQHLGTINVKLVNPSKEAQSGAYAWTSLKDEGNGTIKLNTEFYTNLNYADGSKSYDEDVATGFHPKGTTFDSIISHEFGHQLEAALVKKYFGSDRAKMTDIWNNHFLAKDIVKSVYKELKQLPQYRFMSETQLRLSISEYANSLTNRGVVDYGETFAEAVADFAMNGKKANPFSIAIWNRFKDYMNY